MKSIFLQLSLGLITGYMISSIMEALLHKNIAHAKKTIRQFWAKVRYLGEPFLNSYFGHHIIHHGRTFKKNFFTQFRSSEDQIRVNQKLETKGHLGELIKKEKYGLSLYGSGLLKFSIPLMPFAILIFIHGGPWMFLGSLPTLMAYSMMSMFIHPYIHVPYQKVIEEAPFIISQFFKTKYMRIVVQNHFMHHLYPDNNFNLILGGDYILGYYRKPSAEDLEKMRELDIPLH